MTRTTTVLVLALGLAAVPGAFALRLPGRASAIEPLRRADLAAALAGGDAGVSWREAADKLPAKCRDGKALAGSDCSDDARCGWLGARAAVLGAWTGQGNRAAAADLAQRAALRLGGAKCAGENGWVEDARAAVLDAALVHAVLLAGLPAGPALLDGDAGRRVDRIVSDVRRDGPRAIDAGALATAGAALRTSWERRSWLASVPALAEMRAALDDLWSSKVPSGCGAELQRNDLLEDQWRGYLVREVVPQALECLRARLAPELQRRGVDPAALARLAATARDDRGGRQFATDPAVLDAIARLRAPAAAAPQVAAAPARPAGAPPRRPNPSPARAAAADRPVPARTAREPAETPGRTDQDLVRLAERVGAFAGGTDLLRISASRARTTEERSRVERQLLVELHRSVCGALADADPKDLEAARRVLRGRGAAAREDLCRSGEGREALVELLAAAPGLVRLSAAVRLRGSARLLAVGRLEEGRREIDLVPERLRGTTWVLLSAWAARMADDPVTAARLVAKLDPDTLDRLRASGNEEVARLAAHAAGPAGR